VTSQIDRNMASAKPVQQRLLIPLTVVLLVLVGGFAWALFESQQRSVHQTSRQVLEDVASHLPLKLEEHAEVIAALQEVFLHDECLSEALAEKDRDRLLADHAPIFAKLREDHGITHFYFHGPDRVNLLRVHSPQKHGDLINRFTAREAERTGKTAAGIELGPLGTFTLRVVHPVFDGNRLIGYFELGKEVEDVLARMHDRDGIEMAVSIRKDALKREQWEKGLKLLGRNGDWERFDEDVLIYSSLAKFPTQCDRLIASDSRPPAISDPDVVFEGRSWRPLVTPLSDASGAEVGHMLLLHDTTDVERQFSSTLGMASAAIIALLAGLLTCLYVALRKVDRGIIAREDELRATNTRMVEALERENLAATKLAAAMGKLETAKEGAEAADRSKSEFLANMSHEIRTPMTAILGFTESMLDPGLSDSEKLDAIHTIRRNGEHLLTIINDILDISKIEAGKLEVEHIRCSPVQLAAEVQSLMRVRADAKGLPFNIEFIGAVPETIESDPTRLKQILVNLIGNAIKFTETGGVRLITRFVDDDTEPTMQFDVVDTGLGMTKEQISKLFRAFSQADTSTTRKFGGTGLGLNISKRLAEKLGGDITIESKPNAGSTFRLTIAIGSLDGVKMLNDPARAVIEQKSASVAGSGSDRTPATGSSALDCRILLAEDGLDNQRLIAFVLKKAGAVVTVAENGKLAHDAALEARDAGQPFDVILMDMQMPVMDGYEATSQLRQAGYTGPIIALTAHAMASDRQKCINAGCDDYATKPIDRKKLIEAIQQHLIAQTTLAGAHPQPLA